MMKISSLKIIIGLFLLTLTRCFHGYEILFQQAKLTITVPLVSSQRQYLDKNPIIKLKVLDMTSTTNTTVIYRLEESYEFLQLNKLNGQLWFRQESWKKDSRESYSLVITAEKSDGFMARMTLDLHVKEFDDINEFCERFMCFYESVTYHAMEDYNESFKSREIAEISPKIYSKLCKAFDVSYELLNSSNFVTIKNNKLLSTAPLNHEMMAPGPELKVAVQCRINHGTDVQISATKVFNITIVDRNDNLIKVQDKMTNLTLSSPYFLENSTLNPNVIFKDEDSNLANSNIEFILLDDYAGIFETKCNQFPSNHLMVAEPTVVFCNLRFIRDGHFVVSPYCVTFQAIEIIRGKKTTENATVCIHTSEPLPVAMKLRDEKIKKTRKYNSNPSSLDEIKFSSAIHYVLEYPEQVEVLQNASDFGRVMEPVKAISEKQNKFNITKNPLNIFGITEINGVVYVKNSSILTRALPATYKIEITWKKEVKTITIVIIEANNLCDRTFDEHFDYCAIHEFQEECEKACGYGSKNGLCKWRPFKAENQNDTRSFIYATCTPDINTCSDQTCDSLENLGKKKGIHICPQDCMKMKYQLGKVQSQDQGLGKSHIDEVCACDALENCICAKPHSTPTPTITEFPDEFNNNTSSGLFGEPITSLKSSSECGTSCMIITIICPTLLVTIIIVLISIRRRYVKKMKKRMEDSPKVHYRGSNDTEIIHINIMNESHKENYQQTYQKFDFDAKWEIDRNKLILDTTLGEGEFGKVLKAYASDLSGNDSITTVAVKTVKTSNNSVELLALLSEFQLLQEVSHPNVIKLLGACIKGEPPLMVIEYCCFGSLRSYLRLSRKLDESSDLKIDGVETVTASDVLSFAWQICKGMAYLTEMKLVHRDLAARNVLLAEGRICKVSDFGLTRDVYEDDAYLKKSKDRVPVKWMSPESLADHVYTTKTDVWSFGIVGYELITLGATPYPGIPPQNLYHLLRSGYRMERPENCSPEIYTLLEASWADDPLKRPSFKYLASKFEKLLGRSAKYLDVEGDNNGAINNPMYLANVDEISTLESATIKSSDYNDEEEINRLEELWTTPKFKTEIDKVDNKKYLLKYDDQLQLLLSRYDQPKPLAEARSISQKLRYQNDMHTFMPKNSYVNTSQPDLLSTSDRERLIEARYDTPKIKRNLSYVEMRNVARCRKSSQSTTTDSFDDNNEMPCNRTTINENLDFNDLDKLLNTDKEIQFKFSSLNNLNQKMTMNETEC